MFPYSNINSEQRWHPSSPKEWPTHNWALLNKTTPIASAGSCFASRLSKALIMYGFNYIQKEPGPPWFSHQEKIKHHYGIYSARYGNVYSSLQLWQLLQRAWGHFQPNETVWEGFQGVVDPFRPTVQYNGFTHTEEMLNDREQHFQAVRSALKEAEIFLFTIGLNEVWISKKDQALYPFCPGKLFGNFTEENYQHHTLSYQENVDYLNKSIALLKEHNPHLKIILSVSPVPLAASLHPQHILISTSHTKSVLRASVQEVIDSHQNVYYFPSYDLIQNAFNEPAFDLKTRQLKPYALKKVIDLFFQMFYSGDPLLLERVPLIDDSFDWENPPCDDELLLQSINEDFS